MQVRQVRQAALQEPLVLELARQRQEPQGQVSLGQLVLRARQVALLARLQVRLEWQELERRG